MFKLSLDIHGVVDTMPEFFSFLCDAVIKSGGELHIITGSSWNEETEKYLSDNNIKYTHRFSVYDHLIESGIKTVGIVEFPDGTIQKKFEDGYWDMCKGEYCLKNSISMHIDDTVIYNDFFKTPFARFWSHNGKPKASHKSLRHLD